MKGVAIRTVILLVVAVIVIAVALYFLIFVTNFDSLFLSNDQRILKQYSTCALAYCADAGEIKGSIEKLEFVPSEFVSKVGCLRNKAGKCDLTCSQVFEEIYRDRLMKKEILFAEVPDVPLVPGHKRICGSEAAIEFEFTGVGLGGLVPLSSGQMDKLAKSPEWICKPIKLPFTGIYLDDLWKYTGVPAFVPNVDSVSLQHGPLGSKNCIMKSGRVRAGGVAAWPAAFSEMIGLGIDTKNTDEVFGCFEGVRFDEKEGPEPMYTQIRQYISDEQRIFPSTIYVGPSFTNPITSNSEPECELIDPSQDAVQFSDEQVDAMFQEFLDKNPDVKRVSIADSNDCFSSPRRVGTTQICPRKDVDVESLEKGDKLRIVYSAMAAQQPVSEQAKVWGSRIAKCNFKTAQGNEKIKYRVWAEDTTINAWSTFSTCKVVVLDRELKESGLIPDSESPSTIPPSDHLEFSAPSVVENTGVSPTSSSVISEGGNMYMVYQENHGTAFGPDSQSEIRYLISSDGGITWSSASYASGGRLTDRSQMTAYEPSVASVNGKVYTSFAIKKKQADKTIYSIGIKSLDESYSKELFDDQSEKGGTSLVNFGGKLYLFYHYKFDGRFVVMYSTWDGNSGSSWSAARLVPSSPTGIGEAAHFNSKESDSMYPSAAVSSGEIAISFSHSGKENKVDILSFNTFTSFDIYVVRFDGAEKTTEIGMVNDDDGNNFRRQGFSKTIVKDGSIHVFYDEDREISDPVKSIENFKTHVGFKKLVNGEWSSQGEILPDKTKAIQPAPVVVGSDIILFFTSYEDGAWKILKSVGKKPEVKQSSLTLQTDKSTYKSNEPIKFSGVLALAEGSPEGKKVKLRTKIGLVDIPSEELTVDRDGRFSFEKGYEAVQIIQNEAYADYDGLESPKVKFTIEPG